MPKKLVQFYLKCKRDIGIMETEKRAKKRRRKIKMLETAEIVRERERERELVFKPTTKESLVLFVVQKLYIEYQNLKDGLCKKMHNSSSFFFT